MIKISSAEEKEEREREREKQDMSPRGTQSWREDSRSRTEEFIMMDERPSNVFVFIVPDQ
jgi:hypothetical protein